MRKEANIPLEPAKFTNLCDRPRSYEVQLGNGQRIQRKRVHLYRAPSHFDHKLDVHTNEESFLKSDTLAETRVEPRVESTDTRKGSNKSSYADIQKPVHIDEKTIHSDDRVRPRRTIRPPSYLRDYVTTIKHS